MEKMEDMTRISPAIVGNSSFYVRLRHDVTVERPGKARTVLYKNGVKMFDGRDNQLIEYLTETWMTEESVDWLAESTESPAVVYFTCEKLFSGGLLELQFRSDEKAIFSLVPSPHWDMWKKNVPDGPLRLSSHASVRCQGDRLVLEMPLSPGKCVMHDKKCLSWLMEIARSGLTMPVENEMQMVFYRALLNMGALKNDRSDSDLWEFHDLLFFHHSSIGFHGDQAGAAWRLKDKCQPAPLFKPCTGTLVRLPEQDEGCMNKLKKPFVEVLTQRRTGRIPGKTPVTLEEIGALLYNAACVQEIREDSTLPGGQISLRPSPSGGALHSLEIYLLVYTCSGLDRGVWRFDPLQHCLETVVVNETLLDTYLKENPYPSIGEAGLPHVRLVITSRFLRVAWKYEKIAYRLALQDLGCLYQTLGLTATALGLVTCIIGVVDARRLGEMLKLEPLVEPVIGEMLLSSR